MEGNKSTSRPYEALVWLLLTEYQEKVYTPSKFIIESTKPKLETTKLPIQIYDSTIYDFKVASSFKDYLDLFLTKSNIFENALIILSYVSEKYILRDFYMANLAKQYTCWDTAYVDCPKDVSNVAFDYVIPPSDLPTKLVSIIQGQQ